MIKFRIKSFNPRTYIRYDRSLWTVHFICSGFNPRTYIRYDLDQLLQSYLQIQFQSTYLYKVRPASNGILTLTYKFQSTYLYKVRPKAPATPVAGGTFQSTYLYKVRLKPINLAITDLRFNPRTYIRYDLDPFLYIFLWHVSIHVPI